MNEKSRFERERESMKRERERIWRETEYGEWKNEDWWSMNDSMNTRVLKRGIEGKLKESFHDRHSWVFILKYQNIFYETEQKKQKKTHYWAESLSWYSRALETHFWRPGSCHNLFMMRAMSGVMGGSGVTVTMARKRFASSIRALLWNSIFNRPIALMMATRLETVLEWTTCLYWRHSSLEYPDSWIIFICFTIVDLPDSPAPVEQNKQSSEWDKNRTVSLRTN